MRRRLHRPPSGSVEGIERRHSTNCCRTCADDSVERSCQQFLRHSVRQRTQRRASRYAETTSAARRFENDVMAHREFLRRHRRAPPPTRGRAAVWQVCGHKCVLPYRQHVLPRPICRRTGVFLRMLRDLPYGFCAGLVNVAICGVPHRERMKQYLTKTGTEQLKQ